jgi:organic radical activating enzyme
MIQSSIIDKQIHRKELKLRILMTDGCNKNCKFCLNDFQQKPKNTIQFLDSDVAISAIENYTRIFKDMYKLQVYFSGGEPTIHPQLTSIMQYAKIKNCKVILNTNGNFNIDKENELLSLYDEIHFGTYGMSEEHAEKVKRMNGTIQCVYSEYVNEEFIEFYLKYGLHVKVFANFFDNDYDPYINFAKQMYARFNDKVSFRYTGVQENRGIGCTECDKKCVTLKAIWVFPDGSITPCPQYKQSERSQPKTKEQWETYFGYISSYHFA